MAQRQRSGPVVAGDYKYKNHVECEENEDAHVVKPTAWPPTRIGRSDGSVNLQCRLCSAWLVVYEGHATGTLPGVKVILPEQKKTA